MKATLYPIDGPWPGRLAILLRPRGGDWLEDEAKAWKEAGIDVVLSALTEEEMTDLDLTQEGALLSATGIEFINFPIPDRGVPDSRKEAIQVVHALESKLAEGKSLGLHCRQGVGRSALLAACLLASAGIEPGTAFGRIQKARGTPVPDTPEQRDWVIRLEKELLARAS